jgi:hypothetical protein
MSRAADKVSMSRKLPPSEAWVILEAMVRAECVGLIRYRTEKNKYLAASYCGTGGRVSHKWNVKVYRPQKITGMQSVVCVDFHLLDEIVANGGSLPGMSRKKVITIDDSGWGFPLCGVMVGVTNGERVETSVVPIRFFRHDTPEAFKTRAYLDEYARVGEALLWRLKATPQTHRIEICTGYVNAGLKEQLREHGYEVRVVEVTGLLQDELENEFRAYVAQELGDDIYFDPKDMDKSNIPRRYGEAVAFGREHCPHLLKTGWEGLEDER